MLPNIGSKLDGGLPRQVTLVRELEYFEGPILSQYRAAHGGSVYIEKWCARDGGVSRFLLVRSEPRAIAEFLGTRITMLKLLTESSDGIGFLIDRRRGDTLGVYVVALDSLPKSYLPKPTRMHDESLRPEWDTVPQDYLLDEQWDAKQLATIERHYLNAAGFAYLTKPDTDRVLPWRVLTFTYDGGYPVMHAFNSIRANVPEDARARSVGVSANSPGVLSLEAPAETAGQLREALKALPRSLVHYHNVHEWSKLNPDQAEDIPRTARAHVEALCGALGVDARKLFPAAAANGDDIESLLVAGKLIAAYYRVLLRVIDPVAGTEFTGVHLDQVGMGDVEVADEDEEQISIKGRGVTVRR